jgi:hypothetical protein
MKHPVFERDDLPFWLAVVAEPWQQKVEAGEIEGTQVEANDNYLVIQWLELDSTERSEKDGGEGYTLTSTKNCVQMEFVDSVIPVKRVGSFNLTANSNASKRAKKLFKLSKASKTKILPLSSRIT